MSKCNLDHSREDVLKKLESQREFLPSGLYAQTQEYLRQELSQAVLNELFHLLKKYDLISAEEQRERVAKLTELFNKG